MCVNVGVAIPPSALPGISPSRGEIVYGGTIALLSPLETGETIVSIQSPPLRGRCPAGQRGVCHAQPFEVQP